MYDRIRRRPGLLLCTLAIFFTGTGWAIASIPGPDGTISACYANREGAVRIIDSGASCRARETAIRWSQQGPAGPQGSAGPQGPAGSQGPAGPGATVQQGIASETVSLAEDESVIENDGPELTLTIPSEGAVVDFMGSMDVSSGPNCSVGASVTEGSGESELTVTRFDGFSGNTERFQTFYSSLEGHGWTTGGMWVVHPLTGGTHVFRMRYQVSHNSGQPPCEARVRNRHIYAVVLD